MRQLVLDLLPPPAPTLDNFVPGRNAEVLSTLREWLAGTGSTTCLLLWGEAHSGCSHLLQAAVGSAGSAGGAYVDCRRDPGLADFADLPETVSLFAADGAEALNADGQVRLFNVYNRLKTRDGRGAPGGRLLVASRQPPAALVLREDLRTRLGSGLVYRLTPLSDAEKAAALEERASRRGLTLPAGALDYLFRHAARDMGSLTALIDALDRFTLEHKRPVTLAVLRGLLRALLHDLQQGESATAGHAAPAAPATPPFPTSLA